MNIMNLLSITVTPKNGNVFETDSTKQVKQSSNEFLNIINKEEDSYKSETEYLDDKKPVIESASDKTLKTKVDSEKLEIKEKPDTETEKETNMSSIELVNVLKEAASEYITEEKRFEIPAEGIENVLELTQEISKVLIRIEGMLSESGFSTEKIQALITEISNMNGMDKNLMTLNQLDTMISQFKVLISEIKNMGVSIDISSLTSKVGELENVFQELNSLSDAKIEMDVINIISSPSSNNPSIDSREELPGTEENLNDYTVETELNTSESIINVAKTDVTSNDKTSIPQKQNELNLEQLKQKVNDKLEVIQKMVTSKDKLLIQLQPKNLGYVEILFKKNADGMEITVEVEEKRAKHQIETMFDDIKKEMKEKNLEFNLIFKEKQNEKENSERKKENQAEYRNIENAEGESFEEIMERVLRGE